MIHLKPCVIDGLYMCPIGGSLCSTCPKYLAYIDLESSLWEEHLEEYRNMSDEKRKYMEDQLKIATGKDKEIEDNDSSE